MLNNQTPGRMCVRLSLFLMLNRGTDVAVDHLYRAVSQHGVSFDELEDDPSFRLLRRKIAYLFKELIDKPGIYKEDLTSTYKKIFNRDLPLLSNFYQSGEFS